MLRHYYGARTSRDAIRELEGPLRQAVESGAVLILAQLAAQGQGNEEAKHRLSSIYTYEHISCIYPTGGDMHELSLAAKFRLTGF